MTVPPLGQLRALLLDVDGTMYDQRPLRRAMAARLLRFVIGHPRAGRRTIGAIRAFRNVLEELRRAAPGSGLATLRYARAAERVGMPTHELKAIVDDWMSARPLPLLARCARPGLVEFVRWFHAGAERRVGVLSDYASDDKLRELGVAEFVDLRLCGCDPEIDAFKPHPHGFLRGPATIWQLPSGSRCSTSATASSVDAAWCGRRRLACRTR